MDKIVDFSKTSQVLVSVVLPVYNAEPYLNDAIDSILNQTFPHFELLIYNDGSSDGSDAIINSYSDERIVYKKSNFQAGVVALLNKGINDARGKYIARMDADDVSLPTRFEDQVAFLEEHPIIGVCGTWYSNFGTLSGVVQTPNSADEVSLSIFYGTPVGHPTVMMRKSFLVTYGLEYNADFLYAEDYDLFERASVHFPITNIPKVLLKYRKHNTQITQLRWQHQYFLAGKIQARHFLRALAKITKEDIEWFENYFIGTSIINDEWFDKVILYRKRVSTENKLYPSDVLKKAINSVFDSQKEKNMYNYFFNKYYQQKKYNYSLLRSFFKEKYRPYKFLGNKLTLFFTVKCLLGYSK